MSRIAFTGNALGTGTVTMAAPNTNSDRTVTLPDTTGTLYISGGDIGTPSAGNGSNLTDLNASNLATGTVPTARLATGTANSTTYLRGDQTWATVTSLPGSQGQAFTSNGTFTIPTGITAVKVTVVGGGGGGAGNGGNQGFSGGGGGAAIKWLTGLTPGGTLSITVGGGGGGGVSAGSSGGTSSVASGTQSITTISASGGAGHGSGGIGSNGSINIGGQGADPGGSGGCSIFGGGGKAGVASNAEAGRAYGGGGGGASGGCSNVSGGSGAAGVVIFEW